MNHSTFSLLFALFSLAFSIFALINASRQYRRGIELQQRHEDLVRRWRELQK